MALPIKDVIMTYDDNGGLPAIEGKVKLFDGVFTMPEPDKPIKFVADAGVVVPSTTTAERDAIDSPQDGAVIFNPSDNELNVFHSSQWNGSAYGNMFFRSNLNTTTINSAGVFEDVLNFSAGELKETTFASDILTTGSISAVYSVQYSMCITDNPNNTYESAIEIDSVIQDESVSCTTIPTGGRPDNISGTFIKTIGLNKDIKLVIRNLSGTQNVLVTSASVVITRIK